MRLLVSGCTTTTKRLMARRPDRLGVLLTPSNGNREWWSAATVWACDNDCFGGLNAPSYLRMLAKVLTFRTRPMWVSCPDVVANAEETERLYHVWADMIRGIGLRVAMVLQDGFERFKWNRIESRKNEVAAVFVGGSTAWKLSDAAARLSLQAHLAGMHVHWGRVNSRRRIFYLARGMRDGHLWCDSFDGSGFSAFGDARMHKAIEWIDEGLSCRQLVAFGGVA